MRSRATLLAGHFCFASVAVMAEEDISSRFFTAKHVIGIGAAHQEADAAIRASVSDLPEVEVDLDDLGMGDDYTSWSLEYRWRFAPRWMLSAMAYTFDEDGRRSVERDFNFDGVVFKAGASVDTELSIDTYIVDVVYEVYQSEQLEIMLGGGLHAFDLETSITGRAFIGDIERERTTGTSELLAPLPNLRAQALYQISDHWGAYMAAGWLSASYEDFDGDFAYLHARAGYWFNEHWAASLGYQWVDIDLTQEKSRDRETQLDATFRGPTLQLIYRF